MRRVVCCGRRAFSVASRLYNSTATSTVKPFGEIAAEMDLRKTEYSAKLYSHPEKIKTHGSGHQLSFHEFTSAYQVGDLVESKKYGLALIVAPIDQDDIITICDPSGVVHDIKKGDLVFRIGPFVDPQQLTDSVKTVKMEDRDIKVMAHGIQNQLSQPMRAFYRLAYSQTNEIKPILQQTLSQSHLPRNVPFFELAAQVQAGLNSTDETLNQHETMSLKFPPSFPLVVEGTVLYAVYKLLERVFNDKVLLNRSKIDCVTIHGTTTEPLLKRFALGDYNRADTNLQSMALEQLRKVKSNRDQVLSHEDAMMQLSKELVTVHGPQYSQERLEFLRRADQTARQKYDVSVDCATRAQSSRTIFCIDASDAGEIDDGISIKIYKKAVSIGVHIADPVSAMRHSINSLKDPYRLTSTAYLPAATIPMLDKSFTDQFGLVSGESRRCLSIYFKFDTNTSQINLNSVEILPEIVDNVVQITYDRVDEILEDSTAEYHKEMAELDIIGQLLRQRRERNGALRLEIPQSRVSFENSDIVVISDKPSKSRKLVEEMMITANHLVASKTKEWEIPSVYRSQSLHFMNENDRKLLAPSTKSERKRNISVGESFRLLRKMNAASLSTTPAPHYSLGLPHYTQFTSPLRRFQDLLVHWQLHSHFADLELISERSIGAMAAHASATQSIIAQAQRDSKYYWILKKIHQDHTNGKHLFFDCVVFSEPNIDGQGTVYCTNYGVDAVIENMPRHDALKVGAGVMCSLDFVNPDTLTLRLKFDTMK